MSEKKSPLIPLVIGVLILAGVGFYFFQQSQMKTSETPMVDTSANVEETTKFASSNNTVPNNNTAEQSTSTSDGNEATNNSSNSTSSDATIDVAVALKERSLGDMNAPVVIREHSSFTCGHCGSFHQNTLDQIKTEYIDTGKVRLIFTDFPLNGPALHAGMIARCLPEGRYFNFVDMLFKSQDKWAFETNYVTYLRQNAALAGLGNDAFDACINNEELRQGILDNMREAQQKYDISSTPTFVFNEDNVVTGARDFAFYKGVIEAELAKAE